MLLVRRETFLFAKILNEKIVLLKGMIIYTAIKKNVEIPYKKNI